MQLDELLLNERDMVSISQLELIERLAICRHVPTFEFHYQKYSGRITMDMSRVLYLNPSELFYQVRNYGIYLLMHEKDHRDRYRVVTDFIRAQTENQALLLEELELLRLSMCFCLRQGDHPYVLWQTACDVFLREPYDEDSSDYHTLLVNMTPEQAAVHERNRLLAWGEINPDKFLDIVAMLRKHHKALGSARLETIKRYIEKQCAEIDKPTSGIGDTSNGSSGSREEKKAKKSSECVSAQ